MAKIIIIIIALIAMTIAIPLAYDFYHPCIKSHVEVQYQIPPSVVVGQSKGVGGIALPIGNATPKNVTVCDERK